MTLALCIFWFNLIVILTLASYPLFVYLRSVFFKKPIHKSTDFECPVSIIIACYNEEKYIRQKMESLLASDEWITGSEIIVVSGGSSDETNQILETFAKNDFVTVVFYPKRLTKIQGVNMAVENAKNEILVFSDCRQIMKTNSVRELIHNFSNSEIGTVTSTLKDHKGPTFSMRNLLNFISDSESKAGSCLNIFGALYAQRKSVFRPFPEDILFDDIYAAISTLNQGKRLIVEKEAIIYDVPFKQYYRKERIDRLTRGLLIFISQKSNMIFRLPISSLFRFIIFKYLKLILPYVLLSSMVCGGILYSDMLTLKTFGVCALVILFIAVIPVLRNPLLHFVIVNWIFLTSTLKFIFEKKHSNSWVKLETSHRFSEAIEKGNTTSF